MKNLFKCQQGLRIVKVLLYDNLLCTIKDDLDCEIVFFHYVFGLEKLFFKSGVVQ